MKRKRLLFFLLGIMGIYLQPLYAELSFLAAGDTGLWKRQQKKVARAMAEAVREKPVTFVLLLGDNFYGRGVKSAEDKKWRTRFEEIYDSEILNIPFYAALGNHDYDQDPEAQVEYTLHSDRWKMPARYYEFKMPVEGSVTAAFFALDTEALTAGEDRDQLEWFREALNDSDAEWKIVYGHHPIHSSGRIKEGERVRQLLPDLFQTSGVDLYLSGHDHHLEWIQIPEGWIQIISGGGSSKRRLRAIHPNSLFARKSLGFARVTLTANQMRSELINEKGEILFSKSTQI